MSDFLSVATELAVAVVFVLLGLLWTQQFDKARIFHDFPRHKAPGDRVGDSCIALVVYSFCLSVVWLSRSQWSGGCMWMELAFTLALLQGSMGRLRDVEASRPEGKWVCHVESCASLTWTAVVSGLALTEHSLCLQRGGMADFDVVFMESGVALVVFLASLLLGPLGRLRLAGRGAE